MSWGSKPSSQQEHKHSTQATADGPKRLLAKDPTIEKKEKEGYITYH